MGGKFDIREYGARPGGGAVNTVAIQKAVDACHAAGGGRVLCGPGTWLTGTLTLKSNVELHLSAGCVLKGSPDLKDYEAFSAPGFRPEHAPENCTESLIRAVDAENIAVTGPGEINGSGLSFYDTSDTSWGGRFFQKPPTARPRMVMFYRCSDVRLEGTSFVDSPCWTMWLMKCERVSVRGVKVIGDQRMINNDGIDFDACRDVTVSDSMFRTADDCIILRSISQMFDEPAPCENVSVANCLLDSWCQGVRIGCPGDGVIRNAAFTNLVFNSANNGIHFEFPKRYLPAGCGGSADVRDILFSNVVMKCAGAPIRVFIEEGIRLARVERLSFSNFRITSGGPCVVEGSSETPIRDVRFSDIVIETSGPDAILCRRCKNVSLSNVVVCNRPEATGNG